jgi:hypothetical protein
MPPQVVAEIIEEQHFLSKAGLAGLLPGISYCTVTVAE